MTDYRYKWVRTAVRGYKDDRRVNELIGHGWEKVPQNEVEPPTPEAVTDYGNGLKWRKTRGLFPGDGVEQGGLVFMRISEERAKTRDAYYEEINAKQLISAGESFLIGSDNYVQKFVGDDGHRHINTTQAPPGKSQLVHDLERTIAKEQAEKTLKDLADGQAEDDRRRGEHERRMHKLT